MSPDDLIAHAERCKVKIKDGRLEFPRDFPAYAGGNKYVSNVPGSTMFMPVTEVTRQYINGLFYVLAQEPGGVRCSSTTSTTGCRAAASGG